MRLCFLFLSVFYIIFRADAQVSGGHPVSFSVPLGGNAWIINPVPGGGDLITDSGLVHWQHASARVRTYVYLGRSGKLNVKIRYELPQGQSVISCRIGNQHRQVVLKADQKEVVLRNWRINQAGYQYIELQGLKRSGDEFARVESLVLAGSAADSSIRFVKNNEDHYFYWGRRGPSVHLNYIVPDTADDIQWFYNEITVPPGNDIVGSYFMADGFAEGYFGMQVNSASERRFLFSVWSPYQTDDPASIPADKRILLRRKGAGVHAGGFGNEGAGGQSYVRFPWKAGQTYRFLLEATPVAGNYTDFTAWFYDPEGGRWHLMASFRRPETQHGLTRLHSFLENFDPETGFITRKAFYGNQWVGTRSGQWKPISRALFSFDATARKQYRLDYRGGVEEEKFFLQNDGFLPGNTQYHAPFSHLPGKEAPKIPFRDLE